MNSDFSRYSCKTRTVATLLRQSKFNFEVVSYAGVKHQAAKAISQLLTSDSDNTPQEIVILVLVNDSNSKMNFTDTTILAIEAHKSPTMHSVSDTDKNDATPLTLRKSTCTQSANEFVKRKPNGVIRLGRNSLSSEKEYW